MSIANWLKSSKWRSLFPTQKHQFQTKSICGHLVFLDHSKIQRLSGWLKEKRIWNFFTPKFIEEILAIEALCLQLYLGLLLNIIRSFRELFLTSLSFFTLPHLLKKISRIPIGNIISSHLKSQLLMPISFEEVREVVFLGIFWFLPRSRQIWLWILQEMLAYSW